MDKESDFYNGEPVMAPITEFVIENIDDYSKLNPELSFMREEVFRNELKEAFNNASSFESSPEERVACTYYVVHLSPKINGKPVDFVVKVLHQELSGQFEMLQEEYEALSHYCPNVTMPTIFFNRQNGRRARSADVNPTQD